MTNLYEILSEVIEVELDVSNNEDLLDSIEEWDSIAVLGMMAKADEELNIALKPDDLSKANTVADLIKLLGGSDD